MNETVGDFHVGIGIRDYPRVFITHIPTGKQWVSKSQYKMKEDFFSAADLLRHGYIKFDPTKVVESCDTRFWWPLDFL